MKVEVINPFVKAAIDVLHSELGCDVSRGKLSMESGLVTEHDINALVGLTGEVQGTVLYGLSMVTGQAMISLMMGQPCLQFDALAQSGISELGNVITGSASRELSKSGLNCNITPPTLFFGEECVINTGDVPRITIPLLTSCGEIKIHIALKS